MYNILEQLKFKLEKIIGIKKHAGKAICYTRIYIDNCRKRHDM